MMSKVYWKQDKQDNEGEEGIVRPMTINANLLDLMAQLEREVRLGYEQVAERLANDSDRQAQSLLQLAHAQRLLAQPTPRLVDVLTAEQLLAQVAADLALAGAAERSPHGEGLADRLRASTAYVSGQRQRDRWTIWRGAMGLRLTWWAETTHGA